MPHERFLMKLIGGRGALVERTRGGSGVETLTVHGDWGALGTPWAAAGPLGTLAAVMVRAGGFCPLLRVDGLLGRLPPWREVGRKPLLLCAAVGLEDVKGIQVLAADLPGLWPFLCVA
jgi:hypothetical protein